MLRKVILYTTSAFLLAWGFCFLPIKADEGQVIPRIDAEAYASFLNANSSLSIGLDYVDLGDVGDKYSGDDAVCSAGDNPDVTGTIYAVIIRVQKTVSFTWYGGTSRTEWVNEAKTKGLSASDWYLYDSRSAWAEGDISGPDGSAYDVCSATYTFGWLNGSVSCD